MNREIKFRGIASCDVAETDVKEGTWVYGQVVFEGETPHIVGSVVESNDEYINLERWCHVRPETVGQFAGVYCGVDVFEGDKVETDTEDGIAISEVVFKVSDDEDNWLTGFALKVLDFRDYAENENAVGLKVIGNIHENPELIK